MQQGTRVKTASTKKRYNDTAIQRYNGAGAGAGTMHNLCCVRTACSHVVATSFVQAVNNL